MAGNAVSTTVTSTTAQDLGEGATRIAISVTQTVRIRFGEATVGAAVATDFPLYSGRVYVLGVVPGRRYFRAIRESADGVLTWARVD